MEFHRLLYFLDGYDLLNHKDLLPQRLLLDSRHVKTKLRVNLHMDSPFEAAYPDYDLHQDVVLLKSL